MMQSTLYVGDFRWGKGKMTQQQPRIDVDDIVPSRLPRHLRGQTKGGLTLALLGVVLPEEYHSSH